MTNATATTDTTTHAGKARLMNTAQANEWGQITDLEPHATYFVMRKPTVELTKERSKQLVDEFRGFLQDQRIVTEKQVQDFQEKYAEPAKARAKELRTTLERRFDEIAKEVEARVAKLETELQDRAPGVFKNRKADGSASGGAASGGETPGEMPRGDVDARAQAETSAAADTADATAAAPKKKGAKKSE